MTTRRFLIDLDGLTLSDEEQEMLMHPLVSGVILFSRNYENNEQLGQLVHSIQKLEKKINEQQSKHSADDEQKFLISVDHEGGRVQRFKHEFTHLPAVATLGAMYSNDSVKALETAKQHGWLMAAELKSMGVDFSFAPVLDLDYGVSTVIGDRAFHADNTIVAKLASAYVTGMKSAGMAATGKHFPGHGAVIEDSHKAIPVDNRTREAIFKQDMLPFKTLISEGLDAVMPAHVTYSQVDDQPAGFSKVWLQDILRQELGFEGVIFSDDLTMEGASVAGGFADRAYAAMEAGCDMILACNNRAGAIEILDNVRIESDNIVASRIKRMQGDSFMNRSALLDSELWQYAVEEVTALA